MKGLINVDYEFIHGWHTFTSKDIYGLFSCATDPLKAFNNIPKQIKALMKKNHNINVTVTPLDSFGDFLMASRKEPKTYDIPTKKRMYEVEAVAL